MANEDNQSAGQGVAPAQPGAVVTPGQSPATAPPEKPVESSLPPEQTPIEPDVQTADFTDAPTQMMNTDDQAALTWTASEFVAHEKSASWYLGVVVAAAAVAALIWLLTKDLISAGVVIVAGLALCVAAGRQPRQLAYHLDDHGITIGEKHFGFEEFRSFSIVPEGAFSSIVFMPLRRFATTTTIYYAPDDENNIVQLLSDKLPLEEHQHDAVDRFMRRIRF